MTCTIHPATVATNYHVGRSGFRSFKTAGPIHYPQRWQRDFLVQSTLDPAIDAIQALPEVDVDLFGVLMWVAGVERRVLVARDEHAFSLASRAAVVVPRSYVLAEPRCSTARMVWSARKTLVSARIRLRTVSELRRNPQGIAIGLLSDALSASTPDPTDAILALACAGQIEIDLAKPFSPDTIVRLRPICATPGRPSTPAEMPLSITVAPPA